MRVQRVLPLFLAVLFFALPGLAQEKQLTIDELFDPQKRVNFNGVVPHITWQADGLHYLQTNTDPKRGVIGLTTVEAATGTSAPFHDAARLEQALTAAGLSADEAKPMAALLGATFNSTQTAVLINHKNDLYYYELGSAQAVRLTNSPNEEEREEAFSPDGKQVSFVRDNNLFVVDLAGKNERAMTKDGGKNLLNGVLDWVYEEEVYGRGNKRGYWWNSDSTAIAFLQIDESGVPEFTVTDDVPQGQKLEVTQYPKAGDTNPRVKLAVVNAQGGTLQLVDLAPYQSMEFLITRVGWKPDSKHVVFEVQNREQTWLDLNVAKANTGKIHTLLREESKAWVDVVELPQWHSDGSFFWQSDRTGWRHLYHYTNDGKLMGTVTKGNWDVREVYGLADGWLYFSASEHSPIANHSYRVKFDGSEFTRLTGAEGNHQTAFNPKFTAYIDVWSTVTTPPQTQLFNGDGKLIRTIEENKPAVLGEYRLGAVEFLKVPTRDGFEMEAMMIKPPGFDPSKKYPVMSYNYSGPGAQSVRNAWGSRNYLWHQMLAQRGYLIWICDNRSATNKGVQSTYPIYRNLGELELRDLEDGVAYLKKQPFVDASRIGLWGWSYGGFMTSYALTHSTSFKIGIAGGPVTDWHNYDSIYTERYMALPKNNPEGYKNSSVTLAAKNLSGKLLIIHGLMDDNVHIQNSVQLVDALQRSGKQFDLMLYPQSRHGLTQPQRIKHWYEMMTKFITENL